MTHDAATSRQVERLRRLAERAFDEAGLAKAAEAPHEDAADLSRPYQNIGGDDGLELLV